MPKTIQSAVFTGGVRAKQKLANHVAIGDPEDPLRAPFEQLLAYMAELAKICAGSTIADPELRAAVVLVPQGAGARVTPRPDLFMNH
jgi:hypothetical protein